LREFDQNVEDLEVALREGHLKRLHVQPVACQHAPVVSPAGIRRGPPAARVGAVDHVVMDQRGAMDQLNNGAQPDRAASSVTRVPSRKQQQGWAQSLASALQQVARDFRHRLDGRAVLERKLLLDLDQVVTNEIKNFLRRQK
jgi:hypothetical protein